MENQQHKKSLMLVHRTINEGEIERVMKDRLQNILTFSL